MIRKTKKQSINEVSVPSVRKILHEDKSIKEFIEDDTSEMINSEPKGENQNPQKKKVFTRYLQQSNIYSPIGDMITKDTLPAGLYKVLSTMQGPKFECHNIKTDSLLRFEDERYTEVLEEIQKFWGLKEDFERFGFNHKRGILLYGAPGTGKSCLIKLVQEDVIRDGNVVLISNKSSDTLVEGLKMLRDIEPDRKVLVVLEDIDEIIRYNEHAILELFDGDDQTDNILYLGTTNYVDRLPVRILRTGRFDRKLEVGVPPKQGRMAYLTAKLEGIEPLERIESIANKTKGFNFSQLREFMIGTFCLKYGEDEVIERILGGLEEYNTLDESKNLLKKVLTEEN